MRESISRTLGITSLPAHLIVLWRENRFDLLTSAEQLDELMRVIPTGPCFLTLGPQRRNALRFSALPRYAVRSGRLEVAVIPADHMVRTRLLLNASLPLLKGRHERLAQIEPPLDPASPLILQLAQIIEIVDRLPLSTEQQKIGVID
jgi:hypothetical protein